MKEFGGTSQFEVCATRSSAKLDDPPPGVEHLTIFLPEFCIAPRPNTVSQDQRLTCSIAPQSLARSSGKSLRCYGQSAVRHGGQIFIDTCP